MDSQKHLHADQRDFKPKFIMWYERDFQEDFVVRRMTPHQRAMYRNLLMHCYYSGDRPYLIADDEKLWMMAEAESLEDWRANKSLIMSKFKPEDDGLMSNKRVLVEWDILLAKLEHQKNAGLASAAARRARVTGQKLPEVPPLNAGSTPVQPPLNGKQAAGPPDPMLERMAKAYSAAHDGFLPLAGKQQVFELRKAHGEETVEKAWDRWLNTRNIEGLACPLIAFAQEFPQVLEAMRRDEGLGVISKMNHEAEEQEREREQVDRAVASSFDILRVIGEEPDEQENAVRTWCQKLYATADKPILNGYERGTDGWEYELCEWARKNPPPVLNLRSLDWRADETLELEIEKGKTAYERAQNPGKFCPPAVLEQMRSASTSKN